MEGCPSVHALRGVASRQDLKLLYGRIADIWAAGSVIVLSAPGGAGSTRARFYDDAFSA